MNLPAIWMCIVAIVVCIVLGYKFKINVGVPGLAFAFIIGCWYMKQSVSSVVGMFPIKIVVILICSSLFYGFANHNGLMAQLGTRIMYPFRKIPWMAPIALFFTGVILGALGCGVYANTIFMTTFGFALWHQSGRNFSPLLVTLAANISSITGSGLPWASFGAARLGYIANVYPEMEQAVSISDRVGYLNFILSIVIYFICYFLLKGYKSGNFTMEEPKPMTKEQKRTLAVLAVAMVVLIVPGIVRQFTKSIALFNWLNSYCDIHVVGIIGSLILILLKVADEKTVIAKSIPWNTILMAGGMACLAAVAQSAGISEWIGGMFGEGFPAWLAPPMMMFMAGFMSTFSSALSVVYPTLLPLIPGIVAATGASPVALGVCVVYGAALTGMSPFSTGGSMVLGNCPYDDVRDDLFTKMVVMTVIILIIAIIVSGTGFLNILGH